ncbi:hypothetical protein Sste5346_006980 [Sporothrix stenoceras]|uniref:Deoxyribonuclease NucA/NucB domain-containing protein n=1 Tax=Sporothrix stenoceras TaxID=5173 RepID=A0ABR3YX82_9PEZI
MPLKCELGCCTIEFPVCQPDNFCCPEDTTACGAVNPPYCHYPGTICCPEPADTSCPVDTTCCGTEACCEEGSICMDESVCCLPGQVACESWCCPFGSECSDFEGFCELDDGQTSSGFEPSQTKQSSFGQPSSSAPVSESSESTPSISLPSISIPSQSAPSQSPPPSSNPPSSNPPSSNPPSSNPPSSNPPSSAPPSSTPPSSTPPSSVPPSSTPPSSAPSSPASSPPVSSGPEQSSSSPSPTVCKRDESGSCAVSSSSSLTCSISGTPTLVMPYIPDKTDELIENICLGLRKLGFTDRQQLNYAGPGKASANRKLTDCGGGKCCSGQKKATGVNAGKALTCDEYPFASTTQSNKDSWVGCILGFQNTAGGFVYLKNFLRDELKYTPHCPYIMQIDPAFDCTTVLASSIPGCNKKTTKRQETAASSTNGVFYDSYNNSPGTLIIYLGDLPAGSYSVDVTFPAGAVVSRVMIGDVDGNEYNVQDTPTSGSTYRFTAVLDDLGYSAALIAETTSDDLSVVSWSVESSGDTPPFSSGGSTLPSSTTSQPSQTSSQSQVTSGSSTTTIVTVISGVTTTITTCPVSDLPPPPPPTETVSISISTITTCISGVTITTTTTCPVVTASESTLPSLPPHHSYSAPPPPPPPPPPGGFSSSVGSLSPPSEVESNTSPPPPVQPTTPTTEPTQGAPTTPTTPVTEPTSPASSSPSPSAVVTAAASKTDIFATKVVWIVFGASLLFLNL